MHKSNLIIHPDINRLQEIAKKYAAKFNPADVFWLTPLPDARSIQVKETLEFMERAHLAPVGEQKLFIIIDASLMTTVAQNKTLKTLEDAPAHTIFLLLATSAEQMLNTIKSRCVITYEHVETNIAPLIPQEVKETLKKLYNIEVNEKTLTTTQKSKILETISKINRNKLANCNAQNQMDLLLIELLRVFK